MISRQTYQATLRYFLAEIQPYLDDRSITEIMINGTDEIYIERKGTLERVEPTAPLSHDKLMAAVTNIGQFVGQRISPEVARFDARLPEGHRVHVVLPALYSKGISVTIRKHGGHRLTMEELVQFGSLSPRGREYLEHAVEQARNIIVSGGTGTGKTTFLNALSAAIPDDQRILVLEDASELQLQKSHVVALETRPPDRKGRGAVTIRDLLHSALRMRPDRILVGECRGGEALDMLQAMNTGHPGSMSTVHADSAAGALERLETLALFAGFEIPVRFLRAQIASAIDVIVQLQRLAGKRVVQSIVAVGKLDGDRYRTRELFAYDTDREALVPVPETSAEPLDGAAETEPPGGGPAAERRSEGGAS